MSISELLMVKYTRAFERPCIGAQCFMHSLMSHPLLSLVRVDRVKTLGHMDGSEIMSHASARLVERRIALSFFTLC